MIQPTTYMVTAVTAVCTRDRFPIARSVKRRERKKFHVGFVKGVLWQPYDKAGGLRLPRTMSTIAIDNRLNCSSKLRSQVKKGMEECADIVRL